MRPPSGIWALVPREGPREPNGKVLGRHRDITRGHTPLHHPDWTRGRKLAYSAITFIQNVRREKRVRLARMDVEQLIFQARNTNTTIFSRSLPPLDVVFNTERIKICLTRPVILYSGSEESSERSVWPLSPRSMRELFEVQGHHQHCHDFYADGK